jgi:hypothetical protein
MVRNVIHDIVLLTTLAFIWLIPALLIARLAERRGHNFQVLLIVALVVPWPITLLVVLVMPRRSKQSSKDRTGSY